ncbi:MAG: hypothetical protein HY842_16250 [Bacteroidetes bacterium]|nr:hypothetical protein [Bacteroidota bacterium]
MKQISYDKPNHPFEPLPETARKLINSARAQAYAAINTAMLSAYWEVGRLIVEEEQSGRERAGYGEALIAGLSERLTAEFGSGFSEPSLKNFRQYYLIYPIRYAVRSELTCLQLNSLFLVLHSKHGRKQRGIACRFRACFKTVE